MADISNDAPMRKRGRPSGKKRVPLSIEERRARNAQYERERRLETSQIFVELAEAAGCEPGLSNAEILATVISQIKRAEEHPPDDIGELKRINENVTLQIESLVQRLSNSDDNQIEQTMNIGNNGNISRNKHLARISKKKYKSK